MIFEIILQIRALPHCAHYKLCVQHTSLAGLSSTHRTVTLSSAQAHCCHQSSAYFKSISLEGVPCGFGSLALGYCPSMLLQSEHENCVMCQNLSLKYFHKQLKIRKIKDPQKFSAIQYFMKIPATRFLPLD